MGVSQSKTKTENVLYSETSIQDVVNRLSDNNVSSAITTQRQMTLDTHIRSRIQEELGRLRQEEENLRQQIEQALEKENLDQDRRMAGVSGDDDQNTPGDVKSSAALLGDLEEIRKKADRFQSRRHLGQFPGVRAKSEAVSACYKANIGATLNCWSQVYDFKASVAQMK